MVSIVKYREAARELLKSNVNDEENHDLALGYIAEAYGTDPVAEAEALRATRCVDCSSGSYDRQSNGCRACDFLCSLTPVPF